MITVSQTTPSYPDPEIQAALQQVQSVCLILTGEGNANTQLITTENINKLNTVLGDLVDYYQNLITTATTVAP